jgi:hypothetical protein
MAKDVASLVQRSKEVREHWKTTALNIGKQHGGRLAQIQTPLNFGDFQPSIHSSIVDQQPSSFLQVLDYRTHVVKAGHLLLT